MSTANTNYSGANVPLEMFEQRTGIVSSKRKPGRPAGSKTEGTPVVIGQLTRCPLERGGCNSTEREDYFNVRTHSFGGVDNQGNAFDTVVWRRTRCRKCGRVRDDKFYEMRGTSAGSAAD